VTRRAVAAALALGLALACSSPAPPPPAGESVVHVLRPGETIYRLSRYYDVSVEAIVRANHIRDVADVPVGARIVIPGARHPAPADSLALASVAPRGESAARELALREAALIFEWPLHGRFSSGFGRRGFHRHEGIDIAAPKGTPVRAAEAGRVIESGWLGDYGRIIVVKHAGYYSTVYAHNRKNKVSKGDFVERGQVIAEVGATGNASGPHLHFEVRRDSKPEDPLAFLPPMTPAPRAATR